VCGLNKAWMWHTHRERKRERERERERENEEGRQRGGRQRDRLWDCWAGISMCLGPDNVKNCLCSNAFTLFANVRTHCPTVPPTLSLPLPLPSPLMTKRLGQQSLCYFHFTLFGCWLKHDIYWLTTCTYTRHGSR